MSYESWRISFQSSEQAARSAFADANRYRETLVALTNSPEGLTPNQLRAIDMVLTPERFIQKG